ncbi:hypothetical protein PHISP_02451 [Aspergillus sp. HF37]|nr:hypothetical protein PHISP_02451 [Aspergillus sp. HF37]
MALPPHPPFLGTLLRTPLLILRQISHLEAIGRYVTAHHGVQEACETFVRAAHEADVQDGQVEPAVTRLLEAFDPPRDASPPPLPGDLLPLLPPRPRTRRTPPPLARGTPSPVISSPWSSPSAHFISNGVISSCP